MASSSGTRDFWTSRRAGVRIALIAFAFIFLAPTASAQAELLLFGGKGRDVFLGCLTCSQYDSDSVLNRYGSFGSRYSATSIFNPYGDYGSKYGTHSACNRYASEPPVIVDRAGNFYGRLTLNRSHGQATSNTTLLAWLAGVCPR
jgi:hypothetical protein